MATLETVMQLKQQGIPEPQIIQTLQQQGISPKEITEALSQSNIKNELAQTQEVSSFPGAPIPETAMPQQMAQPGMPEQQFQQPMSQIPSPTQGMQPSLMATEQIPAAQPPMAQEMQPSTQMAPEAYPIPSPTDQMPYYDEYQPQQSTDIETINDIAEQIVEEKTVVLKRQITEATRFKDELVLEIEKINQRLEKIEGTFNQLQMAILGKVGEYGEDIKNISKEMHTTQDSFSKMINPLADNLMELKKINGKPTPSKPKPKTKKDSNEFENYLR